MGAYMGTESGAGSLAAFTYGASFTGEPFPLQPGKDYGHGEAAIAAIVFMFVVGFVVLSVTTTKYASQDMFGLAIPSARSPTDP